MTLVDTIRNFLKGKIFLNGLGFVLLLAGGSALIEDIKSIVMRFFTENQITINPIWLWTALVILGSYLTLRRGE